MDFTYKTVTRATLTGDMIVFVRFRTETEMILTKDNILDLGRVVDNWREGVPQEQRIGEIDLSAFKDLIRFAARDISKDGNRPLPGFDVVSEWTPLEKNDLTFRQLSYLEDKLEKDAYLRFDGLPPNVTLVFNDGFHILTKSVTEESLKRLVDELKILKDKADGTAVSPSRASGWIQAGIMAAQLAYDLYKDYREKKEAEQREREAKDREQRERERQQKENFDRQMRERANGARNPRDCRGGPREGGMRDTIGRTC